MKIKIKWWPQAKREYQNCKKAVEEAMINASNVSPHKLYEMANGDTPKYIELMQAHGYIIPKKQNIDSKPECGSCKGTGQLKHSTNPVLRGSMECYHCNGTGIDDSKQEPALVTVEEIDNLRGLLCNIMSILDSPINIPMSALDKEQRIELGKWVRKFHEICDDK